MLKSRSSNGASQNFLGFGYFYSQNDDKIDVVYQKYMTFRTYDIWRKAIWSLLTFISSFEKWWYALFWSWHQLWKIMHSKRRRLSNWMPGIQDHPYGKGSCTTWWMEEQIPRWKNWWNQTVVEDITTIITDSQHQRTYNSSGSCNCHCYRGTSLYFTFRHHSKLQASVLCPVYFLLSTI